VKAVVVMHKTTDLDWHACVERKEHECLVGRIMLEVVHCMI
jgi:hypothetical protein